MRRLPGFALLLMGSVLVVEAAGIGSAHSADAAGPDGDGSFELELPAGFPPPRVPVGNPLSSDKVELGRHLFFDRRLSLDGTFSCADCHVPAQAFTDGRGRAIGVTGEAHPRGAMSLANVAYNPSFNWDDPDTTSLEEQMRVPMFSMKPIEMGIAGHEAEVLERIGREARYGPLFEAAFPADRNPITFDNIVLAIASFERTLLSGNSAYDRYVYWDERQAMTASARRGMGLFFSDRLRCAECHAGFNLSGPVVWEGGPAAEPEFHNTALYNVDGAGGYPADNRGLMSHTGRGADMGRFRAPTLRNIALTAPYMHDGSLETLEEVIDHYAAGGRASTNPHKSDRLTGFALTPGERIDLVRFLESLTDSSFIDNPTVSDPW